MHIALLGAGGLLGQEFSATLTQEGLDFKPFNRSNFSTSTSAETLANQLQDFDTVINCIAYTSVDGAEMEEQLAMEINGDFVNRLGNALSLTSGKLIHFSTDYVFDGSDSSPKTIEATPHPINTYGRSKLAGEMALMNQELDFHIIRTAWLYGEFGKCFPKSIWKKLLSGNNLAVVDDEIGHPTWARDVTKFTTSLLKLANPQKILHATSSDFASRFEWAETIAVDYAQTPPEIKRIKQIDLDLPAQRPSLSVLESSKLVNFEMPSWRDSWHNSKNSLFLNL